MTDLLDFQRRIAGAIMRPPDTSVAAEAKQFVKPNDHLTSTGRLEIYHRQYWYRILDSFAEDFPGLRAILGERAFQRLARAYLADCPSGSFTLRNLGSRLENWLRAHPEFSGKNPALAMDMVRLEWAHIEAFDNAERKPLGPEDLVEIGPDLVVALQPHISLLDLQYPVDDLRVKVSAELEQHGVASNAVGAPAHRPVIRRYRRLNPQLIFLAVHRADFTVYYRRLEQDELRLLKAIEQCRPIGEVLDTVAADFDPAKIQNWFSNWAQLGWLCRGDLLQTTDAG